MNNKTYLYTIGCAIFSFLLGGIVLIGWYIQNHTLIQILPYFVPMQYNTALCFSLCGAGLLLVFFNHNILSKIMGCTAAFIGLITLFQYVFNINTGLDELFMKSYILVETSHPGRMAPNTALCFVLSGTAIFICSEWHKKNVESIIEIFALFVISLSVIAVLGYIQGIEKSYGWGQYTRMSLHSSAGFIMLGSGIIAYVWDNKEIRGLNLPLATLFLLCVGVLHFDMITSLGIATGAIYCLLLFCSLWYANPLTVFIFAIIASCLNGLGLLISPASEVSMEIVMLNRSISLFAIWIVAAILFKLKKTQLAVNLSEQRLQSIIDNAQAGIFVVNEQGIIESFNQACENMFGYPAQEINGKPISVLFPESILPISDLNPQSNVKMNISTVAGMGMIVNARRKNNETFHADISVSELNLSGQTIYNIILRDISELEKLHSQLRHEKKLLQILMDNIPDSIYYKDKLSRFTRINSGLMKRLQLSSTDEALGKSDVQFFSAEYADKTRSEELSIMESQQPLINHVKEVFNEDGEQQWYLDTKYPIINSAGECTGIVGIARDITGIKQTELELIKQQGELKKAHQQMQEFTYVASHDLQEPLRTVNNYLSLMLKKYENSLEPDCVRYVHKSIDAAKRMSTLIKDLLTFSRVTTHGAEMVEVNLNEIVTQVTNNLEMLISENNAVIQFDPLPIVMADKMQMNQLFQNLIGNGLKYQSENTPEIHILCKENSDEWQFSVKDNGIGISPEFHDRIFKAFQRLHTREEYSGTGIGLAICQRIVERHGGTIWVESNEGQGSEFHFTIQKDLK